MPVVNLGEIMIKFLVIKNHLTSIGLLNLLCYIILLANCVKTPTINQPIYRPFLQHQPITAENLQKIRDTSPDDAVFAELLQAFALLRHANLNDLYKRQEILSLLKTATASFEDMAAPENFSLLFSLDENKPFKGFPHERVLSSLMTAVLLMADNKYQEALPYLRNAEFFDARFQKMPFGTDAPLIYALMYRCQLAEKAHQQDLKNTESNIFKSLRFIEVKEPLIHALSTLLTIDIRNFSYNRKIAYMIYEISIYHSLLTSSDNADIVDILDDASKHADIFTSSLTTHFGDEYEAKIKPLLKEFAKVMGIKISKHDMDEVAFIKIAQECHDLAEKIKKLIVQDQKIAKNINISLAKMHSSFHKIIKAVLSDKMTLVFSGMGPNIIREGSYDEITVIKPNTTIATKLLSSKEMNLNISCGFNRLPHEAFSLTLCKNINKSIVQSEYLSIKVMKIWDTSKKASSAQGREFAKILRGRAQFRSATESIAEVSAWSAFFLFYLGTAMLEDCQRKQQGESCYVKGFTLYGIAGATVLFSGAIWLLGKISNPAADSRFIPLLYGEVWLAS